MTTEEIVDTFLPNHVNPVFNIQTGVVPGSRRYTRLLKNFGLTEPSSVSPSFEYTVPSGSIVVGAKSYLRVRCKATLDDTTPILAGSSVRLSEAADSILWSGCEMWLNGTRTYGVPTYAYLLRNEYDRIHHNTNANRVQKETAYRRLSGDAELSATYATFAGSEKWYKDVITDDKEFFMWYPLDHLPMCGHEDVALPPTTSIRLDMTANPNLGFCFNCDGAAILASPRLLIKEVEFFICTEEIEPRINKGLLELMATEGVPYNTLDISMYALPSLVAGGTSLNTESQVNIVSPNMLAIKGYQHSVLKSATPWATGSQCKSNMDTMTGVSLEANGKCLRIYTKIDTDKAQFLNEIESYDKIIPLDTEEFGDGLGTAGVYTTLSDKGFPHKIVEAFKLLIEATFTGLSENYAFFLFQHTERAMILNSFGVKPRL